MVVGETGRCDAPLHGAPVGWGFFRSQAKSCADANPSSLQSVLPPSDGAAVPVHCLSIRARIANTVLAKPCQKLRK
jgi:hypothetical protein